MKHLHCFAIILWIAFCLPVVGHSASFDCGKAATEIEKIICSDDALSRLDESLNKAYLKALKLTDKKQETIKNQRQWLKNERNVCRNAECIKKTYEARIDELGLSSYGTVSDGSPIDGYYAKLIRQCFPNSLSSDCSYVEEGLSIKKRTQNSYYIYIVTRGDNGHFCKYTGIAHLKDGKYVESDGDCTVTISIANGVANLSSTKGCSAYCGARAYLESSGMKKK